MLLVVIVVRELHSAKTRVLKIKVIKQRYTKIDARRDSSLALPIGALTRRASSWSFAARRGGAAPARACARRAAHKLLTSIALRGHLLYTLCGVIKKRHLTRNNSSVKLLGIIGDSFIGWPNLACLSCEMAYFVSIDPVPTPPRARARAPAPGKNGTAAGMSTLSSGISCQSKRRLRRPKALWHFGR